MKEVMELSANNPGAIGCVIGLLKYNKGSEIIKKVKKLGIIGTDLYVLWSDISNKDYDLMAHLCENVSDDLLINASLRQDYSGRELLKEYIESFKLI